MNSDNEYGTIKQMMIMFNNFVFMPLNTKYDNFPCVSIFTSILMSVVSILEDLFLNKSADKLESYSSEISSDYDSIETQCGPAGFFIKGVLDNYVPDF